MSGPSGRWQREVLPAAKDLGSRLGQQLGAWGAVGLGWLGRWGWRALRHPDVQRVLAVGVLVGSFGVCSGAVRGEVESWEAFRIDRQALSVAQLPPGLNEQVRKDLEQLALPSDASAFDPRLVPFVYASLHELPWVQKVGWVRLKAPNKLGFALEPRRPIAQLGEGDRAPLLTEDAAVIHRDYGADPEALPRLLGVPPVTQPLTRRRAFDVGIEVLGHFRGLGLEVDTIDVGNLEGRGDPEETEVLVVLRDGLEIEWGRPEDPERSHIPAKDKLERLRAFLTRGPARHTVERVSLRWDAVVYQLAALAEQEQE